MKIEIEHYKRKLEKVITGCNELIDNMLELDLIHEKCEIDGLREAVHPEVHGLKDQLTAALTRLDKLSENG
jgi:hypothetical protein